MAAKVVAWRECIKISSRIAETESGRAAQRQEMKGVRTRSVHEDVSKNLCKNLYQEVPKMLVTWGRDWSWGRRLRVQNSGLRITNPTRKRGRTSRAYWPLVTSGERV